MSYANPGSSVVRNTFPIRINSPIVACYPWQTSILEATDLNAALNISSMKHFYERLETFESYLSSASTGDQLALRNFLGFSKAHLHLPAELRPDNQLSDALMTALSPKNRSSLIGLLLSYRILDVAAVQRGLPSLGLKHRHNVSFGEALQFFERLDNWPSVLSSFKTVDRLLPPMLTGQNDGSSSNLRHVKVLSKVVQMRGKANAFVNIQLAVLGLHRMLTETPFDLSEGQDSLMLDDQSLSDEERLTLEDFFLKSDKLDLPLRLAFLISPIFLLIPRLLHRSRYDHEPLAMVAKSLGNQRPTLLSSVEKELFLLLFRLATEELDLFTEVNDCMSRMPWDEIREIGESDERSWFKNGSGNRIRTVSLRTADVEGEIPFGWAVTRTQPAPFLPCDVPNLGLSVATSSSQDHSSLLVMSPQNLLFIRTYLESLLRPGDTEENERSGSDPLTQTNGLPPASISQMTSSAADSADGMNMDVDPQPSYQQVHEGGDGSAEDRISSDNDGEDNVQYGIEQANYRPRKVTLRVRTPSSTSSGSSSGNGDDSGSGIEKTSEDEDEGLVESILTKDQPSSHRRAGTSKPAASDSRSDDEGGVMTDEERETIEEVRSRLRQIVYKPVARSAATGSKGKQKWRPSLNPKPRLLSAATELKGKRKRKPSFSNQKLTKRAKKASNPVHPRTLGGSTQHLAINVDDLFLENVETTLATDEMPEKFSGPKITGYSPSGAPFEFIPELHMKEDLLRLQAFDAAIKASFVDGRPPHVSDPANSAFCVMTATQFKDKSVEEVQTILKKQHVLVTGMDGPVLEFNARGLASLATLSTVTTIQDQSIAITASYQDRVQQGTLRDLLTCSSSGGKILNALDFPMPEQGLGSHPFSTDSAAWNGTKGAADCERDKAPPLASIRWGIAATTGALHWWHVDCDGFGTYVDTKAGLKWWIVARRKGAGHGFESFGELGTFLDGFSHDTPHEDRWDVEAVILHPGTQLIMRPNTLHSVFTPQHAICHGGHFYASNTMKDTLFGIVHAFIGDKVVTNAQHPASRLLLRRIAGFWHDALVTKRIREDEYDPGHVPILEDISSVLDLFTFCNTVILMNVLDFRTYEDAVEVSEDSTSNASEEYDLNAIPILERCQMAYARGRCMDILLWFFTVYEVYSKETGLPVEGYTDFAMAHLARQASLILVYKRRAKKEGLDYGSYCTVKALEHQLSLCFEGYPEALQAMPKEPPASSNSLSLDWPNPEKYGVRKLEHPLPHQSFEDLLKAGTTAADAKLFKRILRR